jgi:predicted deacylase
MSHKPIEFKSTTLAGSENRPHLLIAGGVHGDEFEGMAAIRRLSREIDTTALRGRVTLVPVVNEAAYWRGTRTADDELDLTRSCPGRTDGSITQRTAYALSQLIKNYDFFIDLHSGGNAMHVEPLVGYVLHRDTHVLTQQRQMAREFNMPIVWGTSANLDGRTLSVARDANVPALYSEWMGAGMCAPQGVQAYVDGCLNVMGALDMIDRAQPASIIEHIVEDDRDQSGHLQANYPAPMSGFCEPAVKLGQMVYPGDTLGTVTDHLGDHKESVISTQRGKVLCLRVFSRVHKADMLAAILEIGEASGEIAL